MADISYAALGSITKTWRDDAGVLHFEASKATGPNLDGDQQIVDQDWAKTAMADWFRTGGNLREQHSTIAAGKALTLEHRDDGQYISGKVVDPGSALKVEQDVLTGLSIGIKGGRVVKDAAAPGGRIVGGRIVEVSLVDRPCEPTCKLMLAKADDADGSLVEVEELTETADTTKNALPPLEEGGAPRYPITDVASLKKAIKAIGRVKPGDRAKVIAHIKSNAKRLGRSDLIPDNWKAIEADQTKDDTTTADSGEGFTHDPETLAQIRNGLAQCMQAELDELMNGEPETWDLCNLLESLQLFLCWWNGEAAEGETTPPNETKTETTEEAAVADEQNSDTPETPADAGATKVDGATVDIAKAVEAALAPHLAKISSLEAELVEVKKAAAPGGPSRTRSPRQAATVARLETLQADQAYYRRLASTVHDTTLASGYRAKVKDIEAEISKLATAD